MYDNTLELRRTGISNTLSLRIEHDDDCENPLETDAGMWTIYLFDSDYRTNNKTAEDFLFTETGNYQTIPNIAIRKKMSVGLAFWLRGSTEYSGFSITTDRDYEPRYHTGIMVWENNPSDMGAKSCDDRLKDARATLKLYNDWASGYCYGFMLETADEEEQHLDSCWGFIGEDAGECMIDDYVKPAIEHYQNKNGFSQVQYYTKKNEPEEKDADTLYILIKDEFGVLDGLTSTD